MISNRLVRSKRRLAPPTPRDHNYRAYLSGVVRAGNYFPMPRAHLKAALTIEEAALVFHLLNVGQNRSDSDGWIKATDNFLREGLGIDSAAQERILERLCEKDIAEITDRGGRCVRIDVARLESLLQKPAAERETVRRDEGLGLI
jgi:hypothetical protein